MSKSMATVVLLMVVWLSAWSQIEKPTLVETEWLAQNLDKVRILDARSELSSYLQAHIPGAIYLNSESLRLSRGGIPGQILPPERLAEIFGQLGIGNETPVVVYSSLSDSFTTATYVLFALVYLGHDRVAILNGGFEKWQAENRPLTRDIPRVEVANFVPRPRTELVRTLDQFTQVINSPEPLQVIDARPAPMYQEGHIPTAESLPFSELLQSDGKVAVWLSPEAIREKLKARGIDPERPIITYCATGRQGSHAWFTLRYLLGLDATLYEGSWVEWRAMGQPVEK